MKRLSLTLIALFLVAGCSKESIDPAAVSAHEQLYGPVYTSLRDAYKQGRENMRGDVPAAQRKSAGPGIVTKLQDAVTQLDKIAPAVKSLPPEYASATSLVVSTLKDEANIYITYAQKAQSDDPAADPAFMEAVQNLEPTAQKRVEAVKAAEKAYDGLSSKEGLTKPTSLL